MTTFRNYYRVSAYGWPSHRAKRKRARHARVLWRKWSREEG